MSEYNRKPGNSATIKRSNSKSYKFYLLEPPANSDVNRLAKQLMTIKNVEEVFVTDGDYGFIVKTSFSERDKKDAAYDYISRRLGGNFGRVTSYYQYSK